jgi:hypothetical protein
MKRLRELGVTKVRIVDQFIHAHDEVHDTMEFPAVLREIQPHALAVNVTGFTGDIRSVGAREHAGTTTIQFFTRARVIWSSR